MAITDEQKTLAAQAVINRVPQPLLTDEGLPNSQERFNRVMSWVYSVFLMYPKLTYRLASIARDRLLENVRTLSANIEEALLAIATYDKHKLAPVENARTAAKGALDRTKRIAKLLTQANNPNYAEQAKQFSDQAAKAAGQLQVMRDGVPPQLSTLLPSIAAGFLTVLDDINYILRHDEQVDFTNIVELTSRYILDNVEAVLDDILKTVEDSNAENELTDAVLKLVATRAMMRMVDERQDAQHPYVRSGFSTPEGPRDIRNSLPNGTDYRVRPVGDLELPQFVTATSGPFYIPAVENLQLTVEDSETGAILSDLTKPFPELLIPGVAGSQKIVSQTPVDPNSITGADIELLVNLDNTVHIISILAGFDMSIAIDVVNTYLNGVDAGTGCQIHMGLIDSKVCLYTGTYDDFFLPGHSVVVTAGPTITNYENTAAEFFGFAVGQASHLSYEVDDVRDYLRLAFGSTSSGPWDTSSGSADEFEEDFFSSLIQRFGNVGPDLSVNVKILEYGTSAVAEFHDGGSPLALPVSYIGYHLRILEGDAVGLYQLLSPVTPGATEDTQWLLSYYNYPGEVPVIEHKRTAQVMVPAELSSDHLRLYIPDGEYECPVTARMVWSGSLVNDFFLQFNSVAVSHRQSIEFVGPRPHEAGQWRFNFAKADVERGDILEMAIRGGGTISHLSGAVIDEVEDSSDPQEFGNPEDNVATGRRMKLSAWMPCSVDLGTGHTLLDPVDGNLSSYYTLWHRLLESSMQQFRGAWGDTLWYSEFKAGRAPQLLGSIQSRVGDRGDRLQLVHDLADVYYSLLDESSRERGEEVAQALKVWRIAPRSSPWTMETTLRSYDPPDRDSRTAKAASAILAVLEEQGYDRARELLRSVHLPEFFTVTAEDASYFAALATGVRKLSLLIEPDNTVGSDAPDAILNDPDADDVEGEALLD